MDEYVISVGKENNLGFYRLHTIFSDGKIRLNVASNNASWVGELSQQKVEETSQQLNMTPETYLDECKSVLTSGNGKPGIVYAVENGSFVWKKIADEDMGIKVKLGSIALEPTNFVETIQKMMDVALKNNQVMMQQVAEFQKIKSQAENQVNTLLSKLEEYGKTINNMENELMSQFLVILNAKKNKISELEQEVIKARAEAVARPKKPRGRKPKTEETKIDPYGEDTDEEMPMPSTSTAAREACSKLATAAEKPHVDRNKKNERKSQDEVEDVDMCEVHEVTSKQTTKITKNNSKSPENIIEGNKIYRCEIPCVQSESPPLVVPHGTQELVKGSSNFDTQLSETSVITTSVVNQTADKERAKNQLHSSSAISETTISSKLSSTKPKDVLSFFFGDDSPEPLPVASKSHDLLSQFF